MEHHFLDHSSGKFPRAMELLKKVVLFFFPDGMFQTEIRVPFSSKPSLILVSGLRGHFVGKWNCLYNGKRYSGTKLKM